MSTLRQNSETSSKPTYFRGHHWACIGLLINADRKFFATPLWTEIHRDSLQHSQSTRIVAIAGHIAKIMGNKACLILDAFFAVGPVFEVAAQQEGFLHILTRAKKNVVAYLPPRKSRKPLRGRPQIYGEKLHLMALFDLWSPSNFIAVELPLKPCSTCLKIYSALCNTISGQSILIQSPVNHLTRIIHKLDFEVLYMSQY